MMLKLLRLKLNVINLYSVATIYNLHLILLFFKEISNLDHYSYTTISLYTKSITLFFRHTTMLYYKYMKNKTFLIFFAILGDSWLSFQDEQYSTLYILIYNIITTILYMNLYD